MLRLISYGISEVLRNPEVQSVTPHISLVFQRLISGSFIHIITNSHAFQALYLLVMNDSESKAVSTGELATSKARSWSRSLRTSCDLCKQMKACIRPWLGLRDTNDS